MELRSYIEILRRRRWIIAVTLAVTVTTVVIGTFLLAPEYEASATLRVATAAAGSISYLDYRYADRLMNTYAQIATSRPVLDELVERLGLVEPPELEVEIIAETELMQVTVQDRSPTLAALAANTLGEILVFQSEELYSGGGRSAQEILSEQLAQAERELKDTREQHEALVAQPSSDPERVEAASRAVALKERTYAMLLDQYDQARIQETIRANTLSIVEPAVVPEAPSKPRKELNIALGLVVGLVGGVGLAFAVDNLDQTLQAIEHIERVTQLPALGTISAAKKRRVGLFNGNSPQGEAFRRLRANILALDHYPPLQTLMVTSAEISDGKSTVAANLATVMAQSRRKVLVADADMRRPSLHTIFGLPNDVGLSSVLTQQSSLALAVQRSEIPGVWVLGSGPLPPDPAELVDSPQMTALIAELKQDYDLVLLDAPVLLGVSDAVLLAPRLDGVLLVVGRSQAQAKAVQTACQHLLDVNANSIGVVVNYAERDDRYYYHR